MFRCNFLSILSVSRTITKNWIKSTEYQVSYLKASKKNPKKKFNQMETVKWIFASHIEKNYHKNEDISHSYSDICKATDCFFSAVLMWFFFPLMMRSRSTAISCSPFSFSFSDLVMKASILHAILCVRLFFFLQHIWMCYPHANHKPMWMCYISQAHFIRRLKSPHKQQTCCLGCPGWQEQDFFHSCFYIHLIFLCENKVCFTILTAVMLHGTPVISKCWRSLPIQVLASLTNVQPQRTKKCDREKRNKNCDREERVWKRVEKTAMVSLQTNI